jgi:hypothetical protein
MQASPLCDVNRFSSDMAVALTTMWDRWCRELPATSFNVD